jgi:GT2 family glycosyltransferase
MWRSDVIRDLEFIEALQADAAPMYGLDLCLQAKTLGYRVVYTSDAEVLHTPGPRWDGSIDRAALTDAYRSYSRNMTFIALRHLHGPRRLAFIIWWWLVGERGSYGVASAAIDALRRAFPQHHLVSASFKGKSEGVSEWLRHR